MILPFLLLRYKNIFKSIKNNFLIITILALFSVTLFNTILYIGLRETGATNALLINLNVPIVILVLSYFILQQKISINQVFGIIISSIGVVYLVLQGELENFISLEFHKGDLWIILASTIWAFYSVILKFKPKDLSDFDFFIAIVLLGFILLTPVYILQGYPLQREINIVKNNFWIIIYVSFFTSILSYYFWHYGIERIGANKTSQFTYLMPIFGSVLAYFFLGETLEMYHLVGVVFIGIGIYLSLFFKRAIRS